MTPGVLDVAHWDADNVHDLDAALAKAKADGILAVIAKCTQGKDAVDAQWTRWVHAIQRADLLLGAYHFVSQSEPGELQAKWFLDHVRAVGLDPTKIALAMDFETNPNPGGTADLTHARAFVLAVQDTVGRWPLCYGYQSMLDHLIVDPADVLVNCPLWMAVYGGDAAKGPLIPPGYAKAGKSYTLWQYSDGKFSATGLPKFTAGFSRMDRSCYRGTVEDLRAAWPALGG